MLKSYHNTHQTPYHLHMKIFREFPIAFPVAAINIFTGLIYNYANKEYISHNTMLQNIPQIICISLVKGIIYEGLLPFALIGIYISFISEGNINNHYIPGLKFGTINYGPYVKTNKFIKHK